MHDAHDTEPPWHVSDESIAWLAEAQGRHPPPPGCGAALLSVVAFATLLASVILMGIGGTGWSVALGGPSLGWFVWLVRRGSAWRRTFRPRRNVSGRLRIQAPDAPRSPRLFYSFMRGTEDHRYLVVDYDIADAFNIAPDRPAILLPDFDAALGVDGPAIVPALLGSDLAARLVSWSNRMNLTVHGGVIRIPLSLYQPDFEAVRTVCAPFGAFVDRLADPTPALAEIARTDTVFHAVLAWCVLRERVPDAMSLLGAEIDPDRAELLRWIDAGEMLFELPITWPERALVFRGMLSSLEPSVRHRSVLCQQLLGQVPTDAVSAVGLLDMLDAANTYASLRGAKPLITRISDCLIEHGDAETMAWLEQHGQSLGRQHGVLTGHIRARLHAQKAGRLALSGDPIQGALSDARAGEVSLVDEG